jgi:plasmid replication initiation protein
VATFTVKGGHFYGQRWWNLRLKVATFTVLLTARGGHAILLGHQWKTGFVLMKKDIQVGKSNYLVEASYQLSLQEQRLILACLGKIDSRQEVPKTLSITASEYSELMGIDIKNSHRELYKASDKLYERSIKVKDPEKIEEFRWIQKKITYTKGEGKITLTWSDDVLKYICQLKNRFTTYKLRHIANLHCVYSIRLYEILMQFISTNERIINLEEFRLLLQLGDKYKNFKELNKKIIKPAVEELNEKSDLNVVFGTIKKGRKVSVLIFGFERKKQLLLDLG